MPYADIRGVKLHYEDVGKGPPLLLLPDRGRERWGPDDRISRRNCRHSPSAADA